MEISPHGAVALKGAVSLAEVPAALFVIGRRHGRRITVRESILWDRISSPRGLIISIKQEHFSAREYTTLGD